MISIAIHLTFKLLGMDIVPFLQMVGDSVPIHEFVQFRTGRFLTDRAKLVVDEYIVGFIFVLADRDGNAITVPAMEEAFCPATDELSNGCGVELALYVDFSIMVPEGVF